MNSPFAGVLVVVVYDSGSRGNPALRGRTAALATAIIDGARTVERTHVLGRRLGEGEPDWAALDAADAIIFGCPTYMGSGSARMKAFMEESLHPQFLERRWHDKLAAGFTNSAGMSGDKLCTLQQLAGFAAQHGMIWISLGQLPGWQSSSGSPADPNRLASFLGLMAQSNSDQGPDQAPPEGDRHTGELLGRRVALIAHRWAAAADAPAPARLRADHLVPADRGPDRATGQAEGRRTMPEDPSTDGPSC
jgi:NAD(P)H dehydrogenase (quinone)